MENAILRHITGNTRFRRERECPYCLDGVCEYSTGYETVIANPKHKPRDATPFADWLAGQIPGQILRLRFLRLVMSAPPARVPDPPLSYKAWFLMALPATLLLLTLPTSAPRARAANAVPRHAAVAVPPAPAKVRLEETSEIWQVEKTDDYETYTNGLRIDNRFTVANHPRSYLAFSATRPDDLRGERRSTPAGIVFHTTESHQAPFEAKQNSALKRIGESVLDYVRRKRAYNFLIDRFGRVYRVVQESDAANHAGNSIWADQDSLYLNLNQSFLAISFETETLPGQEEATVNPAQVRSAALLTEMLRKRYNIPTSNCVTHAQVSVNPSNRLIGYHIDWASSFPFEQLGLPDNYALPLPSVSRFGFEYDSDFEQRAGGRLYQQAQLAEQLLRDGAAAAHLEVPAYRKALQKKYQKQLSAVRGTGHTDQEDVTE